MRGIRYADMNRRIRRSSRVSLSETRRLVKSLLGTEGRVWFNAAEKTYSIGAQLPEGGRLVLGSGETLPAAFHVTFTKRFVEEKGKEKSVESQPGTGVAFIPSSVVAEGGIDAEQQMGEGAPVLLEESV